MKWIKFVLVLMPIISFIEGSAQNYPEKISKEKLDTIFQLILKEPAISRYIEHYLAVDSALFISVDHAPECYQPEPLALEDYPVYLWQTKDMFFYGVLGNNKSVRMLEFYSNWSSTRIELLFETPKKCLLVKCSLSNVKNFNQKTALYIKDLKVGKFKLRNKKQGVIDFFRKIFR
jgi:hypothetical protein